MEAYVHRAIEGMSERPLGLKGLLNALVRLMNSSHRPDPGGEEEQMPAVPEGVFEVVADVTGEVVKEPLFPATRTVLPFLGFGRVFSVRELGGEKSADQ